MGWREAEAFRTSLVPSSCHQRVPQRAGIFNTFSFPPQHRFLPCENKSKAVEQVKSAFSKVSCTAAGRVWGARPRPAPQRADAKPAPSFAGRDCGNPTDGVTSAASEELSPRLYLFSVKCLWGFLNDCSPPLQACGLSGWPACEHSERGAGESDKGNRK